MGHPPVSHSDLFHSKWFLLLASAALLFNAWQGLTKAKCYLIYRELKRSENGYLFWYAVGLSATAGVLGLLVFFGG